jgi:hypothetical protein
MLKHGAGYIHLWGDLLPKGSEQSEYLITRLLESLVLSCALVTLTWPKILKRKQPYLD